MSKEQKSPRLTIYFDREGETSVCLLFDTYEEQMEYSKNEYMFCLQERNSYMACRKELIDQKIEELGNARLEFAIRNGFVEDESNKNYLRRPK